jgi:hypothetical protein
MNILLLLKTELEGQENSALLQAHMRETREVVKHHARQDWY